MKGLHGSSIDSNNSSSMCITILRVASCELRVAFCYELLLCCELRAAFILRVGFSCELLFFENQTTWDVRAGYNSFPV